MSAGQAPRVKRTGRHFTPPALAAYLARLAVQALPKRRSRGLDVLDPACGDGALLAALLDQLGPGHGAELRLVGIELDALSLRAATRRLRGRGADTLRLEQGDFIQRLLGRPGHGATPDIPAIPAGGSFDLVLANPPYVRTQVLGATRSRELARRLKLSGRVDLYQAFVRAMTLCLRPGGLLALLCPNRFMTTRSGAAMRELLLGEYRLLRIIDLGDTGLFSAAVLPAIVIARRRAKPTEPARRPRPETPFVRIYRTPGVPGGPRRPRPRTAAEPGRLIEALEGNQVGRLRIGGRAHRLERGRARLPPGGRSVWRLLSPAERSWTGQVESSSVLRFEDLARIRVGVKTTADAVFIRDDWSSLPAERRPEAALLRPLLTHRDAATYVIRGLPSRQLLYPHTVRAGRRRPVDLSEHPRARAYLEQYRSRLASRQYLIDAGREWFELWVPHHPDQWGPPKIVVPDISDAPRFYLDRSGAVVNGDCYWLSPRPDQDPRLLLLILAVGNSSLATRFYDNTCSNRLYSGRRRYITQYLNSFPVPDPHSRTALRIMRLVQRRLDARPDGPGLLELELEIDRLVAQAFGVGTGD